MRKQATTIGGWGSRGMTGLLACMAGAWLAAPAAQAATWDGGTATWTDTDNGPWTTTAPVAAEVVNLNQVTASDITITYAGNSPAFLSGTELVAGTRFGILTLNNGGGGTTTLAIGTGDLLPTGGTATIGPGGKLDISGGTLTPDSNIFLTGGQIVQTGGLIQPRLYDLVATNGSVSISAGEANFRQILSGESQYGTPYGSATVEVTGTGILRTRSTFFNIGANDPAAAATFTVNGGSLIAASQLRIQGANGLLDLQAGSVSANHLYLEGGIYDQTGGTLTLVFDLNATSGQATLAGASSAASLRTAYVGTGAGSTTMEVSDGATVTLTSTGGTGLSLGGSTGSGSLTVDAASVLPSTNGRNAVLIGAGGHVVLQNGAILGSSSVAFGNLTVGGGGSLTQNSGSHAKFIYTTSVNDGQLTVNDGTLTLNTLNLGTSGGQATMTINGGAVTYGQPNGALTIGGATGSGRLSLQGGTLQGYASGTGDHLIVNTTGVVEGYATVSGTTHSRIDNSGRIIADGGTLDLSGYTGGVTNPTENSSDKGWFAVDQGKLIWPTRTPVTGNSSINWGEPDGDTTIDLVNSARIDLFGVSQLGTMTFTGALLATDHGGVPDFDLGMPKQGLISVHDFTRVGFNLASFDLTIRYDDVAAGGFESVLRLFHYTGGAWVDVTTSLDVINHRIVAAGLTSFSLFAVGYAIPEPASAMLLAAAGLAGLRGRRRD